MGIDIGDLSTTMLCSVPPTTASYLQRIGRAGRSTGTALVVSVVNQRPHDLFFFARPEEMLAGKIEPPGCWLDASAMLVRQYLAYCFDSAVKDRVIDSRITGVQPNHGWRHRFPRRPGRSTCMSISRTSSRARRQKDRRGLRGCWVEDAKREIAKIPAYQVTVDVRDRPKVGVG
jgi:ATP-dependent helicase YprA (DUF1998 family)